MKTVTIFAFFIYFGKNPPLQHLVIVNAWSNAYQNFFQQRCRHTINIPTVFGFELFCNIQFVCSCSLFQEYSILLLLLIRTQIIEMTNNIYDFLAFVLVRPIYVDQVMILQIISVGFRIFSSFDRNWIVYTEMSGCIFDIIVNIRRFNWSRIIIPSLWSSLGETHDI